MSFSSMDQILRAMLVATTSTDMRSVLMEIGDYPDVGLDQPFGPFKLLWHPFGDNPSNLSTIGLATKAGRSLTERLTNAMDAILEARAPLGVPMPPSPRAAAKQWFDRPISGPDDGLFRWAYSDANYDRMVHVILNPSGKETAPTIDVVDRGVGIQADQFPGTILSLQAGNKITKFYVIGAFGQGGASTLAFCDYALIVSRHKDNPRMVGFTAIRVLNLNETYKEDSYAYLCTRDLSGKIRVPSFEMAAEPLPIYNTQEGTKLPSLTNGTLVRHYSYKLPKLDGSLAPSPGNLYHYLHCSLFDPLLPFRVIDLRDPGKVRDELVTGSRNRLMRLVGKTGSETPTEETGSEIKHYRPMEYVVPYGTDDASIGIEYWVVLNYRKGRGTKREEVVLRPYSNELYLQTGHPVIGTLNGQNQGELTAQILKDLNLGMVSRHIVIHIDTSNANSRVRRELFSTNREGFKEGDILKDLTRVLEKMLQEDEVLQAIERELTEKLARREAQSTSDEVKRQVTKLLLEAGLQVKEEGPSLGPGQDKKQTVRDIKKGRPRTADPLPTLPFPEVTKFVIVTPRPKMSVRVNDNEVILIETDADSEFDRRGLLAIRTEPDVLEQAAKAPLRGGRVRWRLRPRQIAKPGDIGQIIATITKPDGSQLKDVVDFEVLPPLEEKTKKEKGYIPPFEIIPINPEDYAEHWGTVWPDLGDEATPEEQSSVAYRPLKVSGAINVYYSTVFAPLKEQVDLLKSQNSALSELFRTNYEIWIGYHAILQENSRIGEKEEIEGEVLERLLEADRVRVAKMQIKQALYTAELMQKVIREQATE
jgi:hypothetical protein